MDAFLQSFGSRLADILALAVVLAGVYLFIKRLRAQSKQEEAAQPPEQRLTFPQVQIIIREEIRDVCELALVRKTFVSEILIDDDTKIPLLNVHVPGTTRKLRITYSGTIVCGFDLTDTTNMREELIGDQVKVFIPQSRILHLYPDMKSVRVYEEDTGIFVKNLKPEEQNALIAAKVEEYGQQEIQQGLLLRADENARKMLMARIINRVANQSLKSDFNFEVLTLSSGNVRQLNSPQ